MHHNQGFNWWLWIPCLKANSISEDAFVNAARTAFKPTCMTRRQACTFKLRSHAGVSINAKREHVSFLVRAHFIARRETNLSHFLIYFSLHSCSYPPLVLSGSTHSRRLRRVMWSVRKFFRLNDESQVFIIQFAIQMSLSAFAVAQIHIKLFY